jgi:hypothetical protein
VKGERIRVDGSTIYANAALRTIVRRDTGESYRAKLSADGARAGSRRRRPRTWRFDRKRKGKTLSSADWKSPTDRDAGSRK